MGGHGHSDHSEGSEKSEGVEKAGSDGSEGSEASEKTTEVCARPEFDETDLCRDYQIGKQYLSPFSVFDS